MKPQDILIALKIVTLKNQEWTQSQLAESLKISAGEVSNALDRLVDSRLLSSDKKMIFALSLKEFLIYGLKYVFPARIGTKVRGIPTAHSAPPINEQIVQNGDGYVWSYSYGTKRGLAVSPLYKTVPKIVANEPELYKLLVLIDALRVGRARERSIALVELDKIFLDD